MTLQLHVWGPAFGLPSIDAECLAAIAYLAETLGPADYQLIQSSPSAVPSQHLPALHDPSTGTWTSGFTAITSHLHAHPPSPPQEKPTPQPHSSTPTARQQADKTAYTAFLTAHAAPLLSLSLYVSSANYAACTRPAYSAILPFPLPWTEPPAVRAAMARRAEHLGMSSLDTDAELADAEWGGGGAGSGGSGGGLSKVDEAGWIAVPGFVKKSQSQGVKGALSPEQKARIRLEGLAREVLDVLGEVGWEGQMLEARCLAFGYLALMLVPEVLRPWLREVLLGGYPGLCEFVRGVREEVFPESWEALPWAEDGEGAVAVGTRFARGVLCEVPGIGEQWRQWWTARKKREVMASRGIKTEASGGLLLLFGAGLGLAAASAGVFWYRGLPPFGAAVQVWRKPVVTLSSFGAAGAMFSGALYGLD